MKKPRQEEGCTQAASTHCGPSASSVPITMEPTIPYYEFKSFIPCFHWVATQALTQHLSKLTGKYVIYLEIKMPQTLKLLAENIKLNIFNGDSYCYIQNILG